MSHPAKSTTQPRSARSRRHTRSAATLAVGAVALLSGCGSKTGPVVDAIITTTVAPNTAAPQQLAAPTTTTTTTVPPTTAATTTTTTSTTVATTSTSTTIAQTYSTPAPAAASPTFPDNQNAVEAAPMIGRIRIPDIKVDMSLYDGITMPTLDLGPGHWPGTAWPGQPGNVVIGGHRTSHHAVFRNVDQLQAGDQIIIDDSNGTHTYAVSRIQIVEPTDTWIVNTTETATVTLFACHPPGSTRQRIVVFGDLVT